MNTVCDSFDAIASVLADFLTKHRAIFLRCDPEITDFRPDYTGAITLLGTGGEGVQFIIPTAHLNTFVGLISAHVFSEDRVIFTWDVKRLFSYLYHRLPRSQHIGVAAKIIDIKYGESFLGIEGDVPVTFEEAKRRAKVIAQDEKCRTIQAKLDIPLATRVLPKIETYGWRDAVDRMLKYSTYHIGGQVNGRLLCKQLGSEGVYAHGLKVEDRARYRPGQDNVFVDIDFKAMEVCVLQWLSGDERLRKIISSGRDIYTTIYSLLYGQKCTDDKRQFIKEAFLPIVYGMQAGTLSARLGVSRDEAETLITKIGGFFEASMDWVQSHQDRLRVDPVAVDHFGRRRRYEDNHHAVRNQVIQGPAAVICLEKLIALYDRLCKSCEIVATIHDGYILDVPRRQLYDVVFYAVETLQAPSDLAAGLLLKVDVKVGTDLANMTTFNV